MNEYLYELTNNLNNIDFIELKKDLKKKHNRLSSLNTEVCFANLLPSDNFFEDCQRELLLI